MGVLSEDPGGTIVQTRGQGAGHGKNRGVIRVDAKTGQLVRYELGTQLNNDLTVDEHQLVGATIRTKYATEFSSTTTTVLKAE